MTEDKERTSDFESLSGTGDRHHFGGSGGCQRVAAAELVLVSAGQCNKVVPNSTRTGRTDSASAPRVPPSPVGRGSA